MIKQLRNNFVNIGNEATSDGMLFSTFFPDKFF